VAPPRRIGFTPSNAIEAILSSTWPRYSRDQGEFDRAIGFVDATFALALTLLVTTLDVDDPRVAFSSLRALYDALGDQFVAFAIAFAVIAKYWLEHHRLLASFAAIDYSAIVVNLFLIAAIVLLPFSTHSVGDPGVEDLPLPTVIMAVNVVAASLLHTLVYVVAVRRNLLSTAPSSGEVSYFVVNGLAAAVVFAASVPVAYLISPIAAQITWIGLLPIGWLLHRYTARWRRTTDTA
jgi:TMEM175 potassium channel family protein